LYYQLIGTAWPLGQFQVPVTTIINDVSGGDSWSLYVRGMGSPMPPIFGAQPLDQSTFNAMKAAYPSYVQWIRTGPGVQR
jgi:hypothetical protein